MPELPAAPSTERTIKAFSSFARSFYRQMRGVNRALHLAGLRLDAVLGRTTHDRARCRICSPYANPTPLCIDGHAYHQRRRNRRKGSR